LNLNPDEDVLGTSASLNSMNGYPVPVSHKRFVNFGKFIDVSFAVPGKNHFVNLRQYSKEGLSKHLYLI